MTLQWIGYTENIGAVTTVHSAVSRTGNSVHWVTDEKELHETLATANGAVVFLKEGIAADIYELCKELIVSFPLTSIILLVSLEDINYKRAMHAGAVDAIGLPASEMEITQAVRAAEESLHLKLQRLAGDKPEFITQNSRVITIFGTKGGIGKTTLAVNLAVALAKNSKRVAVLDLDLQFGDVAIFYDLQPKRTIYEWAKEDQATANRNLDRYMMQHDCGVEILAAPLRPEFAEVITGEHVGLVIGELRRSYDYILVDTPPSLVETSLVALENSEDILMVTSMDLPTLKNSKLGIETLESLGMKDRLRIILNRDSKVEGIRVETVENIVGMPIYTRIPSEGKIVVSSVNKGVPFVLSNPREAVAKSVFSLAAKLHTEWSRYGEGFQCHY